MMDHRTVMGFRRDEAIARRRKVVREKVLACKALWTEDEASFHGDYVNFESSWAWPKPVQRPHPPIVIGASPTPRHFEHIIEYGDAWMPIEGRFEIDQSWVDLRRAAADAGRDPSTLRLGVFNAKADLAHLEHLREIGTSWIALGLPPLDRDAALAKMDEYAPLVEAFNRD